MRKTHKARKYREEERQKMTKKLVIVDIDRIESGEDDNKY